MSDHVPKYYTTTEIRFPNISIKCTISYSYVVRAPEMFIGSLGSIDEIMRTEFKLSRDARGECNVKYKLISLPTIAMTPLWTGRMDSNDWAELHNKQIAVEGSFRFTSNGTHETDNAVWHKINIECISTTAILD